MTKCVRHKWIQLTNESLEERLLPPTYTPANMFGCRKCGVVREGKKAILDMDLIIVRTHDELKRKTLESYWKAFVRFNEYYD